VAQSAAEKISSNNNKEALLQMGEGFFQGTISIATAALSGGPVGLVATLLTPLEYWHDESITEGKRAEALNHNYLTGSLSNQKTSVGEQIKDNVSGYLTRDLPAGAVTGAVDAARITATTTETSVMSATAKEATVISGGGVTAVSASEASVISVSQKTATTTLSTVGAKTTSVAVEATTASASKASAVIVGEATGEGITAVATKSITMTSEESLETAVKAGFSGSSFIGGLGIGLAGAIVNAVAGDLFDTQENALYEDTINTQFDIWKNQFSNNMKVIADRK
jgi:hypothetical protein